MRYPVWRTTLLVHVRPRTGLEGPHPYPPQGVHLVKARWTPPTKIKEREISPNEHCTEVAADH